MQGAISYIRDMYSADTAIEDHLKTTIGSCCLFTWCKSNGKHTKILKVAFQYKTQQPLESRYIHNTVLTYFTDRADSWALAERLTLLLCSVDWRRIRRLISSTAVPWWKWMRITFSKSTAGQIFSAGRPERHLSMSTAHSGQCHLSTVTLGRTRLWISQYLVWHNQRLMLDKVVAVSTFQFIGTGGLD